MKKTNLRKLLAACTAIVMTMGMFASCGSGGDTQSRSYISKSENRISKDDGIYDNIQENVCIDEDMNNEEYASTRKNGYKLVSENPLSTFSTDVDTASYTNVRRMINNGEQINTDAVRVEEFINYFKYNYPQPKDEMVGITTDLTDCPWNNDAKLMLVGMQAKAVETKNVPMNLVFLIDVSGSMMSDDKRPLVQQAFSMLAENLGDEDRISIVTYAGEEKVVLEGAKGSDSDKIINALNELEAGGSTAGEAGINKAYKLAEENYIEGGNNRVILATDGDLNVGVSSAEELTSLVEQKRETGIALSVLGFGTGNLKDDRLEALADNGNGNYSYIDSLEEAERVLVTEMSGTLFTVAKDAKIQVEFNPQNVYSYKLIGYENRALNDEDFDDDTKDAGDIGAGQQVTALYEIILAEGANIKDTGKVVCGKKDLKYESSEEEISAEQDSDLSGELLTVSMRFKNSQENENDSRLVQVPVAMSSYHKDMADYTRFAAAVAQFAMYLRGDKEMKSLDINGLTENLKSSGAAKYEYYEEFKNIVLEYQNSYK